MAPPPSKSGGGTGTMMGVIILVVIMVVAGAGTFFALGSLGTSTTTQIGGGGTHQICIPSTACQKQYLHDAQVFSPFRSAEALSPVSFQAIIPNSGAYITSATFFFGDGTNATSTLSTATLTHTYSAPGAYYVYVTVVDSRGNSHDNIDALAGITVAPSSQSIQSGQSAVLSGSAANNGIVSPGNNVALTATIQSPPSASGWAITTPGFVSLSSLVTVGTTSGPSAGSYTTSAALSSSATTGAVYTVVFSVPSSNGVSTVYSNYTFNLANGVYTAPPVPKSPHPGIFDDYVLVPSGGFSEDPAVDYETVGYEPILNVFQALISYNGSLAGPYPSDYVPNLATCVPGSAQCTHTYGNTLVSGDNYTFVLNPTAKFYNPTTGTSSTVYPVDVVFSIARDCLFATFPFGNPGWILCQALLPGGNGHYDGGLHSPYNNTPANILNAVIMNSSAYCPSGATDGCVTFDTQYSGHFWPDFLEFVADPLGASVLSCRFAASVGGNLPGLACGATTNPSGISNTAWDNYQLGMGSTGTDYQGTPSSPVASWATTLRWSMVGSGPYYMSSLTPGASYTIKVNPNWVGTTCSWTGCIPATFAIKQVNEVYENTAVQGETALESGQADLASVPPTDFSNVLIPLLRDGKVTLTSAPGLSIFFTNFDMSFSQSGAQGELPAGTTLNAPSTLFQDLAFRQFLEHAFPYQTVQSQYNSVDGIPLNQIMGGAIPQGMGNYYPANVSWPLQDPTTAPATSPDSAVYWWNMVQSENGIAAKSCTSTKPCVFPFPSYAGAPLQDEINGAWVSQVSKLSNGAVQPVAVDISFYDLVVGSFSAPGTNPFPMYELGWAPDYPDPTDYVAPMWQSDNVYTYGNALCEGLIGNGCAGSNLAAANYNSPCQANYIWSNSSVTEACQGTAYSEMNTLLQDAAFDTNLNERVILYNAAAHIAEQLGLMVSNPGQSVTEWGTASWINGASMNTNPTIGGGADSSWYTVSYAA